MVIAAGRRKGRQGNDWRTFNEKRTKQAKTRLYIRNLCETEHPGDYDLNPKRFGAFVRDGLSDNSSAIIAINRFHMITAIAKITEKVNPGTWVVAHLN